MYVYAMALEHYNIKASTSLMEFEFVSVGRKGKIKKVVQYSPTGIPEVYNLGFGDLDLETGNISDTSISDNGDSQKVLGTVSATVLKFVQKYPNSQVIAVGTSKSRTRLYQIGISNNLDEIIKTFDIYGLKSEEWEPFERGHNYNAFLIRKKK